jgi:uncharacterized membrane protein YqjE
MIMSTNQMTEHESVSVGELIKGIAGDMEALATQHMRLFKKDIKEDFQKIREATAWLAAGLGVLLVGGALLGLMLVHGLIALEMRPWAAYGLVAVLFTGVGVALLCIGRQRIKSAMPLSPSSSR